MEQNPNVPGLAEFITFLGKCRKENPVIGNGRYRELLLTNRQYAFARIGDGEAVIVAVNNDENPAEIYVPLPIAAEKITDLESGNAVHADNGKVKINLEAGGSVLLKVN